MKKKETKQRAKEIEKNHTLKKKVCLLFPGCKPASNQTKIIYYYFYFYYETY
jgi:hypothetical protein